MRLRLKTLGEKDYGLLMRHLEARATENRASDKDITKLEITDDNAYVTFGNRTGKFLYCLFCISEFNR